MLASDSAQQQLIDFFHKGKFHSYKKNDYLIGPDGIPRGVFYIESGLVKSYDITRYGEENLLIIRKSGEIIGLTWAITGELKHIINMALAPTTAWLVTREQFRHFINTHPEATFPVIDTLTDMYRLHSERIMTLEYRSVRERLASFLLTMTSRFGTEHNGATRIDAPLRQQDIASSINASRETTSRTLASLQQYGIINIEQSIITIINMPALESIISQ